MSETWTVVVNHGAAGNKEELFFHSRQRGEAAVQAIILRPDDPVSDDFGSTLWLSPAVVNSIRLYEISEALKASIEQSLAQTRAQMSAQRRLNNDPAAKILSSGGTPFLSS